MFWQLQPFEMVCSSFQNYFLVDYCTTKTLTIFYFALLFYNFENTNRKMSLTFALNFPCLMDQTFQRYMKKMQLTKKLLFLISLHSPNFLSVLSLLHFSGVQCNKISLPFLLNVWANCCYFSLSKKE